MVLEELYVWSRESQGLRDQRVSGDGGVLSGDGALLLRVCAAESGEKTAEEAATCSFPAASGKEPAARCDIRTLSED